MTLVDMVCAAFPPRKGVLMSDAKMFQAEVTQYMRPNGTQKPFNIELPKELEAAYDEMRAAGCRFEAEVLMTSEVSVTVSNGEMDVDIQIIPNGPKVPEALCKMLKNRAWEQYVRGR